MKKYLVVGSLALMVTGCFSESGNSNSSFIKDTPTEDQTSQNNPDNSTTNNSNNSTQNNTDNTVPDNSTVSTLNCPSNFECYMLTVPKDYNDLSLGNVKVHFGMQKARVPSERIGALVFNFGGPGGAAVDGAAYMASTELPKAITDKFDIVGIDPRGSGQSAFAKELTECSNSLLGSCESEYTEFAQYIGTNSLVKDIDSLRQALGDDKLNFLGYSYGTRVGALYAEMFPNQVRTLILDAPMPPNSQNAVDLFRDGALGRDIIATYRLKTPARKAKLEAIIEQIYNDGFYDDNHGNRLNAQHVAPFLYDYLAARDNQGAWQSVEQATFTFLDTDDASQLFNLISIPQSFNAKVGFNNEEDQNRYNALFKAVVCTDEITPITPSDVDNAKAEIEAMSKIYGVNDSNLAGFCSEWDNPRDPIAIVENMSNKLTGQDIMVIAGKYDDATPYIWGESMERAFGTNATFITIDNLVGHAFSYTSIPCLDEEVTHYIVNADIKTADKTCDVHQQNSNLGYGVKKLSPLDNIQGIGNFTERF
ncbi:secretory tripeptidyl aminopeptidase [Vibrio nigripulchritudo ATCC 27043]|uniref:alpha/beta fold hydrolase n=1 Tax=Vibrio nigripulchritudo TaxID=28173 RepID=UPI00021C200B|nr:alpha/beta fold hydrolase [Vibrio nigripulchritudo]EGU50720.1 secretory tripeptidyl aminopeptidase [Vibrio nigripulchritudo ATCC 27043]